ncbi:hypothetical protein [Polaribacter sp. Q13]|uniref:hypothetical protein n=1 Tax=Polaribacter sp. Q13 TaxID=2806551 RepID=UPI00193BCE6D|nr:hypothetical protein [Polaribacter sp. Q13]QVY66912.1 hypothetical protein JOP69_06410 [Polaribacter sp. Q13]
MKNIFSENIIWQKLENRKIKIFSIVGIFLFYVIYNLNFNFQNNVEMSFFELLFGLGISMSLGIFVSGIILYIWFEIEQKKNTFLNKSEILNFDYLTRIYILYYVIMLPFGMLF